MSPSINIPHEGEPFVNPNTPLQWAHVTVGSATTNDVVVGEIAEYVLFNVDEPIAVVGVWTQTETAFTASVTVTVGDSTTLDRYLADTTINPAASGAVLIASTGLSVPFLYSAAQDLKINVGGATVAAGLLHVYVQYALIRD